MGIMDWKAIGLLGIALLVLLNAHATATASKASGFLKSQIRNQIILIWLLPVIGALIVIIFHRSSDDEDPPDDGSNSSDMNDAQLRSHWVGADR